MNAPAIIDHLIETYPTARTDPSAPLTPSCTVGKRNPDMHEWCGFPGVLKATGWTPIPCGCECHRDEAAG
jgi:hypothetical protein